MKTDNLDSHILQAVPSAWVVIALRFAGKSQPGLLLASDSAAYAKSSCAAFMVQISGIGNNPISSRNADLSNTQRFVHGDDATMLSSEAATHHFCIVQSNRRNLSGDQLSVPH